MNILKWNEVDEFELEFVPEDSGVYLIVARCSDKKKIVIYSGQSDDIYRRLNEHWSDSEQNEQLKHIIKKYPSAITAFFATAPSEILDGTERYLFNHFQPQYQDKAPDVNPNPCSLPEEVSKGNVKAK